MTVRTRLRQWFRDLFTPIGDEPVIPPAPKPIGMVLLGQVIVTEVIGHNAPLIDEAAFIASPTSSRPPPRRHGRP